MKELVQYLETVLNFSTISQPVHPVGLSGVPSVYGKKGNTNTAAVFKTFYEISVSASSYCTSFTYLV
jgi:hypothetical protein